MPRILTVASILALLLVGNDNPEYVLAWGVAPGPFLRRPLSKRREKVNRRRRRCPQNHHDADPFSAADERSSSYFWKPTTTTPRQALTRKQGRRLSFSRTAEHHCPRLTNKNDGKRILTRQQVLGHASMMTFILAASLATSSPTIASAAPFVGQGEQRIQLTKLPTAPIGALLPALQQRLLLEAALEILRDDNNNKSNTMFSSSQRRKRLQSFVPPLDQESVTPSASFSNTQQQQQDARVLKRFNPALVLRGDLTRASMNLYTSNLNYDNLLDSNNGNSPYTITDPQWKKSYIRANDGLPNLQQVVRADLDLRNLYRNQVELRLSDAAAELYYNDATMSNGNDLDDNNDDELLQLLQEAAQAFDQWLDRVRPQEVQEALAAALRGERTQVYDPWAAGFLPPKT